MITSSKSDLRPWALEAEDLTVAYDLKPVLWDIDLRIPKGELTAIIGPNGAGKTTLIKAALNLVRPVSGMVRINAERVAYVPQSESVDWDFPASVMDVVLMGRYGLLGWFRRPGRKDREIALESLAKVSMTDFASRQISELSGGQQQRVFLARALAQEADLYLMDEPFKGVDVRTEKAMVSLLKELKDEGKSVIAVHHNLQTVKEYFGWAVLVNLHIIAAGAVEDVFVEENIAQAYRNPERIPIGIESETESCRVHACC